MKRILSLLLSVLLVVSPLAAQRIPLNEVITLDVETFSPTTSQPSAADTTPTCKLYEETTDTPIITGSMTLRTSTTGEYRMQMTLSAANGVEVGKWYTPKCVAVVGGVTGVTKAMPTFMATAAEGSAGYSPTNWADIVNPTTVVVLSGTTVKTATDVETDTANIQSRIPAALVGGRMDSSVGAYQSGSVPLQPTVAGRKLDVSAGGEAGLDWANIGSPTTAQNLSATIISGAGIVTTVNSMSTGFLARLFTVNSGTTYASSVGGSLVKEIADNAATGTTFSIVTGTADSGTTTTMVDAARTEADNDYWKGRIICFTNGNISGQCAAIEDFVAATDTFTFSPAFTQGVTTQNYAIYPSVAPWDWKIAEHLGTGTTGEKLNAAASAGDPWTTAVPGAYGAGTAGYILGTNLDGTVSSRSSQTSVNTVDDYVDTEVASIQTNTNTIIASLGTPSTTIVNAINTAQTDLDDIQGRLPSALTGGKMESNVGSYGTGQAKQTITKGVALTNYYFKLFFTGTTSAATGLGTAAITCYLSKDGAAGVSLTDTTETEVDATNLPGVYVVGLSATETNAESEYLRCSASNTDAYEAVIVPEN